MMDLSWSDWLALPRRPDDRLFSRHRRPRTDGWWIEIPVVETKTWTLIALPFPEPLAQTLEYLPVASAAGSPAPLPPGRLLTPR